MPGCPHAIADGIAPNAPVPGERFRGTLMALGTIMVAFLAAPLSAEDPRPKLPPRQEVSLVTEDDVVLKASFWPGTKGKDSVPVVLLHGFGENRQDFNPLAEFLHERGCAVVAVDFRGHGDSTQVRDSNRALLAADMPQTAFADLIEDVETVKRFLMGKNNSGELNVDKLCLVGAEMGAVVAANWAITDWNWAPLAVGKQGQDVKAIVLLSPPERFKTLRMLEPLNDRVIRSRLAFYIAVGNQDSASLHDATKIYQSLKRFHPPPIKPTDHDLFFDSRIPTRLQGAKLLGKQFKDYGLLENIAEFIDERAGKQPFVWQDRKLP